MGIMAMSSKAANGLQNGYKYNGIAEESSFDLDLYAAYYRMLDPQLGRWWQTDPRAIEYPGLSAYNSNVNNPVNFFDPWGDDPGWLAKLANNLFGGGRLPVVTITASKIGFSDFLGQMIVDDLGKFVNRAAVQIRANYELQQLHGRLSYRRFTVPINGPVVSMDTRSSYDRAMGRQIAAQKKWMHQRYETQQGQWFGVVSGAAQVFTWEYVGTKVANVAKTLYSMSRIGQVLNAINTGLRIATPYGIVEQSFTKLALKAREEAQ